MGTATTVNVSFEYGPTDKYGQETKAVAATKAGIVSTPVDGLTPKTAYHHRAKVEAGGKAVYGNDVVFVTTDPAPIVASVQPSDITHDSATLNASLRAIGAAGKVSISFEYGTTEKYDQTTKAENTNTLGAFEAKITGLAPNTLYHYRPKADGGANGVTYGEDFVLTTLGPEAIVRTNPAAEISVSSATLHGSLTSLGASATVNVSFEYGPTDKYGQVTKAEELKTTGAFSFTLTGLTPNTTYHARPRAEGADKKPSYGADVTFTTPSVASLVKTEAASNVGQTKATLNGNLTSLGQATTVNVSFEYGETEKYGHVVKAGTLTAGGPFTFDITGLKPGVTYHYRAIADGADKGVGYGADITFTPVSPSSGGRKVTYVIEQGGRNRIYVADEDGTGQSALDTGNDPAWSPDGTKIVYVSDRHPNGQIYVMNSDGSGAKRLSANDTWDEVDPVWSPDGNKIAFASSRDDSSYHIYVMNADGSNARRLTDNDGGECEPAWSPDGNKIAYVSDHEGPMQIYVTNADGTGQKRLTDFTEPAISPAWSSDGKRIAFSYKQPDRNWSIYVMNSDGSGVRKLAPGWEPTWTADGSRLIFRGRDGDIFSLFTINAAGGTPVRTQIRPGAWSPKVGGK